MKQIHVAAAALNQTPLDWEGNARHIVAAIDLARSKGVKILCLPELCITGYGCEDAFFSTSVQHNALRILKNIQPHTSEMVVSIGLPFEFRGALFNVSALIIDGQLVGFATKQRLAGDGLHYEPRWFKPWPADLVTHVTLDDGNCYPIGDLLFDVGGVRIGFEICEDAWATERPAAGHALLAADVILNPSASHFAFDKAKVRDRLVAEASRAFGVTYVYSNLLGNEAGRVIYDGQTLIGTRGEVVARGPRLSFQFVTICDAIVDINATRMRRMQSVSYEPNLIDADHVVSVDFRIPTSAPSVTNPPSNSWEHSEHLREEEFTRAIALALYDYLRKSRSQGFVVSLSGGADSTAVACLVALMVRLGVGELGVNQFAERAHRHKGTPNQPTDLIRDWLTTVYQATEHSSDATRRSAQTLATAIGATHHELDVDDLRASYTAKIEAALGRELTWDQDDLTLQNVQARVRGPAAWMLANVKNALLLATSNRSEAAVGYATMDGDTCGGISPIAGIDKAFLRTWLRWLESKGPDGLGPIPELTVVNRLQPTAELRPLSAQQVDETDLMPYELLDAIEDHAIGEKRAPQEVLDTIRVEFPQYSAEQLVTWTRRFFELWSRNQWKRERYAPSFHVDDKNLDPKTWCRFPILSGGFRTELAQLSVRDA